MNVLRTAIKCYDQRLSWFEIEMKGHNNTPLDSNKRTIEIKKTVCKQRRKKSYHYFNSHWGNLVAISIDSIQYNSAFFICFFFFFSLVDICSVLPQYELSVHILFLLLLLVTWSFVSTFIRMVQTVLECHSTVCSENFIR